MNLESSRDKQPAQVNKGPSARERFEEQRKRREASTAISGVMAPLTTEDFEKSLVLQQEKERKEKYSKLLDLLNRKGGGEKISSIEISKLRMSLGLSQELLESNLDRINHDPKLRDALSVTAENLENNEGKQIKVFVSDKLGEGGMGSVHLAHMVRLGSTDIVDVVMKKPLVGAVSEMSQRLYTREIEIAQHIAGFDAERGDVGGENVMRPAFTSKEKTVSELVRTGPFQELTPRDKKLMPVVCYELIKDADGKARDLDQALEEGAQHGRIVDGLAECMKGLSWLHKRGMLHGDLKLGNMMLSGDGKHKIIDTGAVIKEEEVRAGNIQFFDAAAGEIQVEDEEGNVTKEYETARWAQRIVWEDENNSSSEVLPTSPYYNSHEVLEKLIKEKKPLDAGEKRAMGVILRETLSKMGFFHIYDFEGLDREGDPYAGAKADIEISRDTANAELQKKYAERGLPYPPAHVAAAYQVALKLINAPQSPYEFKGNDPQNGRDPNYISLTDASNILKQVASDFK